MSITTRATVAAISSEQELHSPQEEMFVLATTAEVKKEYNAPVDHLALLGRPPTPVKEARPPRQHRTRNNGRLFGTYDRDSKRTTKTVWSVSLSICTSFIASP